MPGLDTHKPRMRERAINNTDLYNSITTRYQSDGNSIKRWDWETVEYIPNSKLKFKVPLDVVDKWKDIKSHKQGLFNMDISYSNHLFTIEDIRRECAKHFTDKVILSICNSPEKFDEFIYWCLEYNKDLELGLTNSSYNSTLHAAYLFNIDYSSLNNKYVKKTILPPKRKLVNELKKYITIYSSNRIPCITLKIQKDGIITLYHCEDGIETDTIRNIAFDFYKIIKEQADYLRVIQPRDGRRVYVVGTCNFKK